MGGAAISISRADLSDIEAIASLHAQSWRDTYAPWLPADFSPEDLYANRLAMWRSRFQMPETERDLILRAASDREIVGFVCLMATPHPVHGRLLGNLHVGATWKRQGLGRRLLGEAARAALPGNAMHLWVLCDNSAACRFYDAHRGVIHGERREELVPGALVDEIRYVWRGDSLRALASVG